MKVNHPIRRELVRRLETMEQSMAELEVPVGACPTIQEWESIQKGRGGHKRMREIISRAIAHQPLSHGQVSGQGSRPGCKKPGCEAEAITDRFAKVLIKQLIAQQAREARRAGE